MMQALGFVVLGLLNKINFPIALMALSMVLDPSDSHVPLQNRRDPFAAIQVNLKDI